MSDHARRVEPTHYELFGVPASAPLASITVVYHRLAKRCHPDRNPAPEAAAAMRVLNAAYEVLKHPDRRARYDASLLPGAEPCAAGPIEAWPPGEGAISRRVAEYRRRGGHDALRSGAQPLGEDGRWHAG